MGFKILAINPGSTSTKIALYEDEEKVISDTINHPAEELSKFDRVIDQFQYRKDEILNFLKQKNIGPEELSAVVGRGGMLPPVDAGAYKINEIMLKRLKTNPILEHASNLGAPIAYEIAKPLGILAYIYDPVTVDQLEDIARITGIPEVKRVSFNHVLNSRATAMKAAKKINKKYEEVNFVVAHIGGGISIAIHSRGKIIDMLADDEGPFAPERAGRIPGKELINICFSGKYDKKEVTKKMRGNAGLKAHLGTHDAMEVEKMIADGDQKAKLIYEAMAYQIAKGIGELATVVRGKVDAIVLTGGIAYSKLMTGLITERVEFIAPVTVEAGENEMEALAYGVLRVLKGKESAKDYEEVIQEEL